MSVLQLPPEDRRPWPTLGAEVCASLEANLVFGPGDLRGRPYKLDDEDRAIFYRAYEVNPPDHRGACRFDPTISRCTKGNGTCGRRRFDTFVLMTRKGTKKSERAGAFAFVELDREGPVRCDGFHKVNGTWQPIGRPVTDPYIPMVAYTERQAEDTAFASLYVMLSEGPAADRFDIGLSRIMRARGDGKAEALATAPDSRDGARTSFQVKEEGHRWTLPRQLEAHHTMSANLAKRPMAEPWEFLPTTAYAPGEGSLAQIMHESAQKVLRQGDEVASRSRLFLFYRWADESIDISTPEGLNEAIDEASGPIAARWSDRPRIANQFDAAGADLAYLERTWLGRIRRRSSQAFDVPRWNELEKRKYRPEPGALVVLGWHGARYSDAAALVATEIATGHQWPLCILEESDLLGESPEEEANAAVAQAFETYAVWKFYVNPDRWESWASVWANAYGEDRVLAWRTNAWTHMYRATRAWVEAIASGEVSQPGDDVFTSHVGAAYKRHLSNLDDDGKRVWVPIKERADSPFPINAALAAIISWQARLDALKTGALEPTVWTAA